MQDVIAWVASRDWPEVIKTLAPLATLGIAAFALWNWQRQDKAKREAEFLDAIVEATHAYVAEMSAPIQLVEFAKIGMDSHVATWEPGDEGAKAIQGATAYIEKRGKEDSKRLSEKLDAARPLMIRLRSLAAKGQVFSFVGYTKCQNAVRMLTWQFDRAEALMGTIGQPNLNWDNPEVLKTLKLVMTINADDMRKGLTDNNIAVLEFAKETYQRIYS